MQRAFTLLELMIALGIFSIITTVILFNNRAFDSTVLLSSTTYDIGLSIREAQVYGVSSRGVAKSNTDREQTFNLGYGIVFDNNPTRYVLFADTNNPNAKVFDGLNTDPLVFNIDDATDRSIKEYTLNGGYTIEKYCGVPSSGGDVCSDTVNEPLSIIFKRPDTDATIKMGGVTYSSAKITVRSRNSTATRTLHVYSTGQIDVKSP